MKGAQRDHWCKPLVLLLPLPRFALPSPEISSLSCIGEAPAVSSQPPVCLISVDLDLGLLRSCIGLCPEHLRSSGCGMDKGVYNHRFHSTFAFLSDTG